jgi:hypothetical protein
MLDGQTLPPSLSSVTFSLDLATDTNDVRRGFDSRRISTRHYISSSTVVPRVMRVPWSVPTICVVRLKEVS